MSSHGRPPRVLRWSVLVALGAAACAHAELPYDLASVRGRGAPAHPLRLAVLPFADGRLAADGPEDAGAFEYQGLEYDHTRLDELAGAATDRVTELVARHLAAAHTFQQVILVRSAAQAPEADLLLSGTVRRLRGYVEAKAPDTKSGRPEDERMVLAEVLLSGIEVRDAHHPERLLASVDAGWSIFEPRRTAGQLPSPWSVLSEALWEALSGLSEELASDDLSGAVTVEARVSLPPAEAGAPGGSFGALDVKPPAGWGPVKTSSAAVPIGWKGGGARCRLLVLEQKQTRRFHRALGAYRPRVSVWACPRDLALKFEGREEFPAKYLGTRGDERCFLHRVGESNWPGAEAEIREHLAVVAPAAKYVFELPGER